MTVAPESHDTMRAVSHSRAIPARRIAYVQYTNPAGYPPLEHSSQMLADAGWDVLFLGAAGWGSESLRFPEHPRIQVRQLGVQRAGWRQKLHYVYFCLWALAWIVRERSNWVYASDLFSSPVGAIACAIFRIPLSYHEHDSPDEGHVSGFMRLCLRARSLCARRAKLTILPNRLRADEFARRTSCNRTPLIVWNCPVRAEVAPPRDRKGAAAIRFLYHGSIVPERLPLSVIDTLAKLPNEPSLTVVGYETAGSKGYSEVLRQRAQTLGIEDRLCLAGTLEKREELLNVCRRQDVGLALMPMSSGDLNLRTMAGASNKPFDYMSSGLAVLVSRLPEWREMFVETGYGLDCDSSVPESLEESLRWFTQHPEETRAMGERGRQRILAEWNYETQFRPAFDRLCE